MRSQNYSFSYFRRPNQPLMKNLLLCIMLCATITVSAQKEYKAFEIKGTIIAKSDQSPIESATVFVQRVKDSSLVSYTITNKKGEFTLKDKSADAQLRLVISYIGSEAYSQLITLSEEPITLNTIAINDESNVLDEVVILADAPVRVKKDTIEFSLDFFKTKKDASVEEALKLLPGVEIDAQGKITINGKPVSEVLVNGKPFFGNDPTVATKNLTKEIIDKVQIVDTKTKSQAFTGEEGDLQSKSINLTIKKGRNKGTFGHLRAGGGTDERYELSGMLNYFNDDLQLGILGGRNNINRSGFNSGSIMVSEGSFHVVGGGGSVMVSNVGSINVVGGSFSGGGGGITTDSNAGFNFGNNYGKNTEVSANYFFANSSSENSTKNARENILPDRSYFTNATSSSESDNNSHSLNTRVEFKIDSTWLINFRPKFSYKTNKNISEQSSNAFDDAQVLTNESATNSYAEGTSQSFNSSLGVTKKFGTKGGYLEVNWSGAFSNSDQDTYSNSRSEIFGNDPQLILRDQLFEEDKTSNSHRVNAKLNLPLIDKKLFLAVNLDQNYTTNNSKRSTFDNNNDIYDQFNLALSTDFKNYEKNLSPKLGLTFRNEKITARVNVGYQFQHLSNKDGLRPELDIERDFDLPNADASITLRPTKQSNASLRYNLRNSAPSLNQLRPFENIDDPLNTIVGNPNLNYVKSQSISINYFNFGMTNKGFLNIYSSFNFPKNNVVAKTTIDENFVRRTEFVNVNGNNSFSLGFGYNKSYKIDTLQSFNVGLNMSSNFGQTVNFNNGIKYNANNTSYSPGINIFYNIKERFHLTANYRVNINNSKFDLPDFDDRKYLSHNIDLSTNLTMAKKLTFENSLNFNYNPEVAIGFQKSSWNWNSSLSYQILNNKGTISLKAFDILNQRSNARRIATENYIEDSQSTILQQYFMLGFKWNFNSLGTRSMGPPPPPPPGIRM